MRPVRERRRSRRWGAVVAPALLLTACSPPPAPPATPELFRAACESRLHGVVGGQVESSALTETSGIAASGTDAGVVWAHNDSGDTARVFAMTPSGQHLGSFHLTGASATDWEGIAVGPGPAAGQSYLYVGDIGDNSRARDSVVVYRVPEPGVDVQSPPGDGQALSGVVALVLHYPDGAHDAEALLVDPITGALVIVTKEPSGHAGVYVATEAAADTTLVHEDSIALGPGVLVTGGDVSPDGDAVVLRTYGSVLVFARTPGRPLDEAFGSPPCTGASAPEPQGEAVAVLPDGRGYLTVSEGSQPPVNRFDVRG